MPFARCLFLGVVIATALTPTNLMMVVVGCLAGTFIGMLPGLGPISAIALPKKRSQPDPQIPGLAKVSSLAGTARWY